ncbi:MAG TPA: FtsX-like permease family protein, partial [Candidatus Nanoarchaeia archaeon]|nr:FtsX-like permease family protein [Candidatus Nanoarchaeia archaeon]
IGIMKAIGARNSDIIKLFIVEAGIIGLIGGILGTALGSGIALVVGPLSKNAGFTINVTLDPVIIFFGLFFAAGIGILAGILPAYQASRLKPVDALRYE